MPRLSAAPISFRTKSRSSWIRERPFESVSSHVRPMIGTITPALPTRCSIHLTKSTAGGIVTSIETRSSPNAVVSNR
jgi:hypothetical protein